MLLLRMSFATRVVKVTIRPERDNKEAFTVKKPDNTADSPIVGKAFIIKIKMIVLPLFIRRHTIS